MNTNAGGPTGGQQAQQQQQQQQQQQAPAHDRRRCGACGEQLRDEAVLALGRLYHPDHFTCAHCRHPIKQAFQEHRGAAYCCGCYADQFNPKCAGCGQTLRETCVVAMERHWHQSCFVCTMCKQPFPGGEFYLVEEQPYDLDCHWAKRLEKHTQAGQSAPAGGGAPVGAKR